MAGTGISRTLVEDFLYREADCLDRWALEEWLALWADTGEISYVVAPTGEPDVAELEPSTAMFLIADDRYRLQQRVIRMGKKTFHSEYRPSRTRHMYSNVRLLRQTDETVDVCVQFSRLSNQERKNHCLPCAGSRNTQAKQWRAKSAEKTLWNWIWSTWQPWVR